MGDERYVTSGREERGAFTREVPRERAVNVERVMMMTSSRSSKGNGARNQRESALTRPRLVSNFVYPPSDYRAKI